MGQQSSNLQNQKSKCIQQGEGGGTHLNLHNFGAQTRIFSTDTDIDKILEEDKNNNLLFLNSKKRNQYLFLTGNNSNH